MSSSNTSLKPIVVSLRTPTHEYFFETGPEIRKAAYRWTYVLQNRNRWQNDSDYRRQLAEKCHLELQRFGLSESQLQDLAMQRLIEVSIPYVDEPIGWEARILPWEFLISEGTRKAGRGESVSVVRHLDRTGRVPKLSGSPQQLAFLTGAAGPIGQYYDFSGEQSLVFQRVFGTSLSFNDSSKFLNIFNPDIKQLAGSLSSSSAELIHVAGVDSHQAESLFSIKTRDDVFDGMVMQNKDHKQTLPSVVESPELAKTISVNNPAFVFFNLCNSAARTASLCVAEGAGAALGFQDYIDDQLAENFIGDFYDALRGGYATDREDLNWNVHVAFLAALRMLRRSKAPMKGSGIVLWSAHSIWDDPDRGESLIEKGSTVAKLIGNENQKQVNYESVTGTGDGGTSSVTVNVEPKERLNFSLLHNRQPIFERFEIRKQRGQMKSVRIDVELHIGAERPKFSRVLDLVDGVTRLEDEIFVPLTWMRTELLWESVLISAHVEVTWQDVTLYSRSHAIVMAPADDWVDTDENRQSLPSFVYPRDPTISEIIEVAQEVLFGIGDDFTAGFDGYQSIDYHLDDPYVGVDHQVQAIWTSLVRNFKLGYINPPPSFADHSQRIRTPEEVIRGGRGTCIDLTLLLASCLEFVEIYPVIFLLEGHAFPGYWRSDADQENFIVPTDFVSESQSATVWQDAPWLIGKSSYEEVLQQIHEGNIVPLESVWLTQNSGFWEAVEQGWENMRIADEFHSLIDIRFARNNDVTPLPIRSLRG